MFKTWTVASSPYRGKKGTPSPLGLPVIVKSVIYSCNAIAILGFRTSVLGPPPL
jgi:hypothetical protein